MGRWTVPGIAAGIWQDGHMTTIGHGVASLETRQPVTGDTLFQIGSITKVFTATLAMRLVEDGLLDLDAPVIDTLPDLPLADKDARRILTLRHLFAHTGGFEGDRFVDYGRGDDALSKAVAAFDTLRQWSAPGELYAYCNTGFYLAGRIIEQVIGQPFETVMRERVFTPLGLERTVFFPEEAITYPAAVGYLQKRTGAPFTVGRPYSMPRCVNPAGGIVSTVGDLLRFASFHIADGEIESTRLLTEAATREMREPRVAAPTIDVAYGIGWALQEIGGVQIVRHGGATRGFNASLLVIPSRRFALALLTNCGHGARAMRQIERWALEHFRGVRLTLPEPVDTPASALKAIAGTYERHDSRFTVFPEKGRLRVESVTIDEESGEEEVGDPFWMRPVGALTDHAFIVTEGRPRHALIDLLPASNGRPPLLRCWGRLAARREEPAGSHDGRANRKKAKRAVTKKSKRAN
ncbi:MAG: beta-lactamase family protein [Chloroflexia bacterium]|nr:beta-lactamase family protein [Chloroflexia bacterium]